MSKHYQFAGNDCQQTPFPTKMRGSSPVIATDTAIPSPPKAHDSATESSGTGTEVRVFIKSQIPKLRALEPCRMALGTVWPDSNPRICPHVLLYFSSFPPGFVQILYPQRGAQELGGGDRGTKYVPKKLETID